MCIESVLPTLFLLTFPGPLQLSFLWCALPVLLRFADCQNTCVFVIPPQIPTFNVATSWRFSSGLYKIYVYCGGCPWHCPVQTVMFPVPLDSVPLLHPSSLGPTVGAYLYCSYLGFICRAPLHPLPLLGWAFLDTAPGISDVLLFILVLFRLWEQLLTPFQAHGHLLLQNRWGFLPVGFIPRNCPPFVKAKLKSYSIKNFISHYFLPPRNCTWKAYRMRHYFLGVGNTELAMM